MISKPSRRRGGGARRPGLESLEQRNLLSGMTAPRHGLPPVPILVAGASGPWAGDEDMSDSGLRAAAQSRADAAYQPGSYVPVFQVPASVEALAARINHRVVQIAEERGWKAVWIPNVGHNVHVTVGDSYLNRGQPGSHYYGPGQQGELDAVLRAREPGLRKMLDRADRPRDLLDFKGLRLSYPSQWEVGTPGLLYLTVKFGPRDQDRLSDIAGKDSGGWHFTLGHYDVRAGEGAGSVRNKLSHLKAIAKDPVIRQLLKSSLPADALDTIRVVRTDNPRAQYHDYRAITRRSPG